MIFKTSLIKSLLLLLVLLAIIFIPDVQTASAATLIFSDNLENETLNTFPSNWEIARNLQWNNISLPCMNGSNPAEWRVQNVNGSKVIGISINGPSCVTEIIPTNFQLPDASNYEYELDMIFPDSVTRDRNIAFKYNRGNEWYGIKFIDPSVVRFQKVVHANYDGQLGTTVFSEGFQPHEIYNMKINIVNDLISFFIDNSLVHSVQDVAPILTEGTVALQASIGTLPANTVYFDNIKVTDLSPTPTPTPKPYLDVPHFSQIDPTWKGDEYDHSSNHNPVGQQEIEDWGCALTSAAMVLKYHGYDVGPNNQTTNPQTLNQYLIDQGGYTNKGGVIWSYFTQYAQQAKESGNLTNNPKLLEFKYPSFDLNTLQNDLEATMPGIIKVVTDNRGTAKETDDFLHFVVAKGYQDDDPPGENTIHINDPLDLTDTEATLSGEYANLEYRQLGRFIPSNTDLSYIWIYLDDPNVQLLVENQGLKTGIDPSGQTYQEIPNALYFEEGVIANPRQGNIAFGDGQHGARLFALPKPSAGNYHLTFSTSTLSQAPIELHLFNTQADSHKTVISPILGSNTTEQYTLTFDPAKDPATSSITRQISFNDLQEAVDTAHELNWLDDHGHRKLSMFLAIIQRVPVNKPKPRLLKTFKNIIRNMHRQEHLNSQGHQYLTQETDLLIQTF